MIDKQVQFLIDGLSGESRIQAEEYVNKMLLLTREGESDSLSKTNIQKEIMDNLKHFQG